MKAELDFWKKSTVVVLGGGSWGTVLAHLISSNCVEVRVWVRQESVVQSINSRRMNIRYTPELELGPNVKAYCDLERVFEGNVHAVIWALPSSEGRGVARKIAGLFKGDEILLHATKGVEEKTLKRMSEILNEELPCPRLGVISGPNLAHEIIKGEPAATVVASCFDEVILAGQCLLTSDRFRVYSASDVIGVEWAGALKNILAIAAGALDALQLGWNSRAFLLTRGLAEMVRFGVAMGGKVDTFLGLAGMGDVLATCSSSSSRNYRVGLKLAQGNRLESVLKDLGSTAEGVRTTHNVWKYACAQGIEMPITEGVYRLLFEDVSVQAVLQSLMSRSVVEE